MNDYLGALIARSLGRIETIRPRPRSMFEPARLAGAPSPWRFSAMTNPPLGTPPSHSCGGDGTTAEREGGASRACRSQTIPNKRPDATNSKTIRGNPARWTGAKYSKIPLERKKTRIDPWLRDRRRPSRSPAITAKNPASHTTQQRRPEPDDDTAQVRAQSLSVLHFYHISRRRYIDSGESARTLGLALPTPKTIRDSTAVPRTPRDDERGQSGRSGHAAATDKQILENSALQISRSNPGLDARFKTGAESDLALTKQTHADLVTPERLHCEPGRTAECRFPSPPQNTSKAAIRVPAAIMRRMGHDSPYLASPRGDEVVQVTIGRVEVRARPAPPEPSKTARPGQWVSMSTTQAKSRGAGMSNAMRLRSTATLRKILTDHWQIRPSRMRRHDAPRIKPREQQCQPVDVFLYQTAVNAACEIRSASQRRAGEQGNPPLPGPLLSPDRIRKR